MSPAFPFSDIDRPIAHRFEAFARQYPDRIAVRSRSGQTTYGELNGWADRIAHSIVALGAGEVVAVIAGKHAAGIVAALLGVLKAGRIYVALDPAASAEQNRLVLADSGATILLADDINLASAQSLATSGCKVARIDIRGRGDARDEPKAGLAAGAALLIYTSGSTGKPKGVLWSHRSFLYSLQVMTVTLGIGAHDRIALLATMSVFAGPRDALAALLNGACLSLYDLGESGIGGLGAWLRSEAITYANLVVTVFRHFAAALRSDERFPSMRILRISAEALSAREVALFNRHFDAHCRLRVGFATSESGNVTQALIDHATPLEAVLWGRVLDGMEVLILDDDMRELERGEAGLLAVRSRYLAQGYWRQPELTAQVFLPDPAGGERRTYLTGDLARLRADGALEYLGRSDRMVKIRGAKVYLDAVEKELMKVAGVGQAAAALWTDPSGNARLVAYVSLSSSGAVGAQAVRSQLGTVLPKHSVPSLVIELTTLPTTAQGKLDRRALPVPDWRARPHGEANEPRTAVERIIASIWAHVLHTDRVSLTDRFIDLGGDSLQAGRIAAGINSTFGIDIDLVSLFEIGTVEDMASMVAHAITQRSAATRPQS